jgi:anti-sigma factor ChrR (cupin superfamily)
MINHETAYELIPEYVSGLLTGYEREQVETHLRDCAECRQSVETCRQISVNLKAELRDELLHHPTTDEMASFALSPETLSEDNRRRVGFHLEVCKTCADDLFAVKGLGSDVQYDELPHADTKSASRADSFGERVRRLFARPVVAFSIVAASLLLLAIPLFNQQFGDDSTTSVGTVGSGTELTVALAEQTRSGLSRRTVTILPEHQSVKFEMRFLAQGDRNYTVRIATDAGNVIHQERLSVETAQQGLAEVALGVKMLPDGNYTAVVMSVTAQGDPLRVYYPFTIKR